MKKLFYNIQNNLRNFICRMIETRPLSFDSVILAIFAILITIQPYYFIGDFNYFEVGIYLPGIQYILDGMIPYRDFFHLRGPLDLYIPAFLMNIFGEHIGVLYTYFYIGTVLTLVIYVLAAKEIFKTRFVLYLFVPVLVSRTFPRVVFHIWGGLRFGMGILAILFAIYFFKHKKFRWIFLAGISCGIALLISIEIGICVMLSLLATLIFTYYFNYSEKEILGKACRVFISGVALIFLPYICYLVSTQSLIPYFDSTMSVVTNMTNTFPDYYFEAHPKNLLESIMAMNPASPHFKHLTPAYCYLIFFALIVFRARKKYFHDIPLSLVLIAFYGGIMYILAFRKIGASQFEMALQPEKIILFFMCEEAFLFLWRKKHTASILKLCCINFLFISFIGSSWGYSITRYNKRFPAFQYVRNLITGGENNKISIPLKGRDTIKLTMTKMKGLTVPIDQAKNIHEVIVFIKKNTQPGEPIFMFPELGAYHFIIDRPFVGRFPMVTFSWINDQWHNELMNDLRATKPRYTFISKDPGITFPKAYFKVKKNKEKYDDIINYINTNYSLITTTEFFYVYKRVEI